MYATQRQFEHQMPVQAAWYNVLDTNIVVESNVAAALDRVEDTYTAFQVPPGSLQEVKLLRLERSDDGNTYIVTSANGEKRWSNYDDALLDLLDRIVHTILTNLFERGIYAIHAGAVVDRGGAWAVVGRSGQGKTTLTLGLLRRGMSLLSDELMIVEPNTQRILPYRRSLHVRPGTVNLIPELRFLLDRPRYHIGGGSEWALTPNDLIRIFPHALAAPAPLRGVLLLEGTPQAYEAPTITPIPSALAALELLRSSWAASIDFNDALTSVSRLLSQVACARLRVGPLGPTLDAVVAWQEANRA
jgi:hypothetical protein